eukprot:TRINITY_DN3458_c0_g1_i2.p1 TRINITY_DN3458_c0_g1~~TRINITY_DN3458_c0_g1_i2.p1  ORF type:complete len:1117 (-),score=384.81 TRINITY_DN3458_c0_g1_i2:209-3559(-)
MGISRWTCQDVQEWLRDKRLDGPFGKSFTDEEVDGEVLLRLTESDAKGLYIGSGSGIGSIRRLLLYIEELRSNERLDPSVGLLKDLPETYRHIYADLPEIKYIFQLTSDLVVNSLKKRTDTPFENDEEYLSIIEASFLARKDVFDIRTQIRLHAITPWSFPIKSAVADGYQRLNIIMEKLELLRKQLEGVCDSKLQQHRIQGKRLPRLIILAEKLELSPKELRALQYILLCNTSSRFSPPSPTANALELRTMSHWIAQYSDMNPREMQDFFRPSRTHMKQGLFETEDEYSQVFNTGFLVMSGEAQRILTGATLNSDEYFKVDKTALAEVLATEPNFLKPKTKPAEDLPSNDEFDVNAVLTEAGIENLNLNDDQSRDEVSSIEADSALEIDMDAFDAEGDHTLLEPYNEDLEYLSDQFEVIETRIKLAKIHLDGDETMMMGMGREQRKPEAITRELKAKMRSQQGKLDYRLRLTYERQGWLPRAERLVQLRSLDPFEKNVLLVLIGGMISPGIRKYISKTERMWKSSLDVSSILTIFCDSLQDQILCRTYFYKNSKLVKEGIIRLVDPMFKGTGDLMESQVEMDRKLLDYIVGLDTEMSELVDGSDLFDPKVSLESVVLPSDKKKLILDTISNFGTFKKVFNEIGLEEQLSYGTGICFLFFGPSGTGKTMTAHGIANELHKKLLMVNISALGDSTLSKETLRFLFREAKIHEAILFFDECESLFESRNLKNSPVAAFLTEIEKYDGVIVMATNRAYDLDEALHRRINLAIEFLPPDFELRYKIWQGLLPQTLKLNPNVDLREISMNYELTGGFIKNAIMAAISNAITRTGSEDIELSQDDIDKGAKLQLRGHLEMNDFERKVIPKKNLKDLVLNQNQEILMKRIISFEKARKVLFAHWGFESQEGTLVLLHGDPGTGKSAAAEALGYEIGKPLKEVSSGDILSRYLSNSKHVDALFKDAKQMESILVFDDADLIFGQAIYRSSQQNLELSSLLHQIQKFAGIVLLKTVDIDKMDLTLFSNLKFIIEFPRPDIQTRARLWERLIPEKAPRRTDIDFVKLANYPFTGGSIMKAITKAAEAAALRRDGEVGISMRDLEMGCKEELLQIQRMKPQFPSIYQ